jgi:predicted phage terminase large subunit-like protein
LSIFDQELDQETATAFLEWSLRSLAPTDVFAYGEYVFGYPPAEHHAEMIEFILEAIRDSKDVVVLEPRGHAKTTWANTILISWLIATNPNLRIGLISNTARQAFDFSRAIRWTMEASTRFQEIFGNMTSGSTKMTDAGWVLPNTRTAQSKDLTLYAAGAGGAIISKRFDVIICDDILDEENTVNIEQREKIENWFWKTLRPCLVPGGVTIVIGTRWAEEDLYEKLIIPPRQGGRGWRSLVKGAISIDEDGNEQALWPEVWPLSALREERINMGAALFACSYLNDISGLMEGNVFRRNTFQYFDTLDPEKRYTIRMGVDLASSEKERADYTARCTVAEDDDGNFYVLSVYRDRRETHHAEFVNDGFLAYPNISLVRVENQQFQSTLIQEVMRDYPRIPVEGFKSDVDKVTRARAVAAKYEAHRVWHHRSLDGSDFEAELLSFPKAHDDMVDALGFAMDLGSSGFVFGSLRR